MERETFRLIIVDDDEADRLQIQRCLERSGLAFEYYEANTVEGALDVIRNTRMDCVILDYKMPDKNGLDGVKALLKVDPFLAIIMSTGQGDEQVASKAIKFGAMDYISKANLKPLLLHAAIQGALQRSKINRALADQQQALAVFGRVLVHDMKAPMQSILGFARLAEVFIDKEPIDRDQIKGQVRRIAGGALRMNALLDQLHAYADADAQPLFENIPLDELLEAVITNLDATICNARARVTFGNLPTVYADRSQLIQLLQNLIGNGIKYCKAASPEVHVEARDLENGDCVIEVRDNGIGIDETNFMDIFEPFKRLHSQGEFEGTGLGLATCKKIVERHNGQIWCKSRIGEGTSFFFTVPKAGRKELPFVRSA